MSNQIIYLGEQFLKAYTGKELKEAGFVNAYQSLNNIVDRSGPKTLFVNNEEISGSIDFSELVMATSDAPPLLAGGSVVRYLLGKGEWQSDFDFWYGSTDASEKATKALIDYKDKEARVVHSSTFQIPVGRRKVKAQIVDRVATNCPDLFKGFDFTICQFAYMGDNRIITNELAWADFLNRRLRLTASIGQPAYTATRMLKYMQLGFTPDQDAFKWLIDNKHKVIDTGDIEY